MLRLRPFVLPAALAFAALGAWQPIASPDAFWHLATGRWMLAHGGAIVRFDPFRFSSAGAAWIDHEWGFQLLAASAESMAGLAGVTLLRSAIFVLLAWLLWRLGWSIANRAAGAAATELLAESWLTGALGFSLLVSLDGLHGRSPMRPELLTLAFFAALLWILESARGTPDRWRPWLAVPLTVLWVNVHPGSLLAPGIIFLHLLGRRLSPQDDADRPGWGLVLGLPAAAFAALACNPWGYEVVALPFRIRAALADLPASNPDWQRIWHDPPVFLLAVLAVLALITTRLRGRRVDLPSALVLASTVGLMLVAVRFQGLVWIAAFAFLGHVLSRAEIVEGARPLGPKLARMTLVVLLLGCGVEGWRASNRVVGIEPGRFPTAGVAALQQWDAHGGGVGHLFNSAVFGGYVLHQAFPPRQILVDTRNEVDPSILRQIAEARSDARAWRNLIERYELDAALLRYEDRPRQVLGPPTTPGGRPTVELHTTSALLFPPKDWALVHWDDVSMLFLRRTEARATALAEAEYRFVQPEDVQATLQRASTDQAFRKGLLQELERKLAQDPTSRRAQILRDQLQQRRRVVL